ncbi:hypothetical protein [Pseudogemmobacter humi]|nr:hypothetical protein [Pseudogemmobacter humi]
MNNKTANPGPGEAPTGKPVNKRRRSFAGLAFVSVLAVAGCSDEPSAPDIQEALNATGELRKATEEGLRISVDEVKKCEAGSDKDSYLCQFRFTMSAEGRDGKEYLWGTAVFSREDKAWRVDTTTAEMSDQERPLRINAVRMGEPLDELDRMRSILGNRGRCEHDSVVNWCRSPDEAFVMQLSMSSFDSRTRLSGQYVPERDQGGTGIQIVEDMFLSYGFTTEELAICRQGAKFRVGNFFQNDGILPELSCDGTGKIWVIRISGNPHGND